MKPRIKIAIAAGVTLLFSGCASVPMAQPQADQRAKQFIVNKDKSNIYVYRNESYGAAVKMVVLLDGISLGQTASKTYFKMVTNPGTHTLSSLTENTSTLSIDAKAGKNYFVWQEVKMGAWSARSKLHLVSDIEGKKGVLESKLISHK